MLSLNLVYEKVEAFDIDKIKSESPTHLQTTSKKNPGRLLFGKRSSSAALSADESVKASSQRLIDSVARQKLASAIEEHGGSGRRSLSEIAFADHRNPSSGNVSLRKQFSTEEEYRAVIEPAKCSEVEISAAQVCIVSSCLAAFTGVLESP